MGVCVCVWVIQSEPMPDHCHTHDDCVSVDWKRIFWHKSGLLVDRSNNTALKKWFSMASHQDTAKLRITCTESDKQVEVNTGG